MNTIEALQTLYVALGGTLSDTYESIANGAPVSSYNVIPDMIAAIAQKVPTGKSLPTVSSTDNGKLLTVVEGEWAKADAPTELPSVSADDNGKVLKVANGAWGVGTDITE